MNTDKKIRTAVALFIVFVLGLTIFMFGLGDVGKTDRITLKDGKNTIIKSEDDEFHIKGTAKPGETVVFKPSDDKNGNEKFSEVGKNGKFNIDLIGYGNSSYKGVVDYDEDTISDRKQLDYDPIKVTLKSDESN